MRLVPINSIMVPREVRTLCTNWAGSENCMLRAVSSTGGLTTGTIRPHNCDTDEKWYYTIWCDFAADLAYARRCAGVDHEDYAELSRWEDWADNVVETLCIDYNLEDWEG